MNIFPKQRNFINIKAIFFFATQNKNETVALSAKDKISKGHNNNELSRTDNIANNSSNVNNNETKFSLDVDRFLNDLRNAQLYQYNGYERFSKAKELYQQKSDIFLCHAK